MESEEKINLSGKVHYLDYDCEFSTVIDKNLHNSINPTKILDGTWKLNETQGGGCLAIDSKINSAVIPDAVSIYFKDTKEDKASLTSTLSSYYSLYMKTSNNVSNEEASLFQTINPASEGTLTQIGDNTYKFTEENGNEAIIFIENTDEIFMFTTESGDETGQSCIFLPLKKVSFDLGAALKKNWTAYSDGGYSDFASMDNPENDPATDFLKILGIFSYTLQYATMNFTDVTTNDDGANTVTFGIASSFLCTNDFISVLLDYAGLPEETMSMPITSTINKATIANSGNFLRFIDSEGIIYDLSFISDTEAFLAIDETGPETGYNRLVLRLRAE